MRYQYASSFLFITILTIVMSGCSVYHKLPLNQSTVSKSLKPVSIEAVRIKAKSIQHPILKPIEFNVRDGLSPDEAAILAVLANPTLRAIRDQRGIATAQLLQAGILPNPQLSYSLDLPTGGNTQDTVNAFGLGLGWDITSLIAHGAKLDVARSHAQSVDLDIAWKEWQVAQSAKLNIYLLIFTEKQLLLARKSVKLPVALFPHVNFPRVVVNLDAGDRPAEQMAIEVTWPVEEAVRAVPGVRNVRSTTGRGSAEISINFDWGANIVAATLQMESAVY